jgi:pimeloyl-ACP methyl ester carboxylesterase
MIEGYLENGVYYRHNTIDRERRSLVFVHGLSGSSSAWLPYEARFSANFNLLFFDLRGHGKSIKKNDFGYYSLEKIAGDIAALAKTVGVKKFVLIGHSFGALLALDFAKKYPKMLESLVLLAPDYRISQTWRAQISRPFLGLAKIFILKPFRERNGIHIDYSKFFGTGDWDLKRIFTDIKNTSVRVYCYCLWQAYKIDGDKMVSGLDLPVLIMHGKKDSVFPCSDSARLAKKISNARLEILPQANHILVINNSQEVGDGIDKFVGIKNI